MRALPAAMLAIDVLAVAGLACRVPAPAADHGGAVGGEGGEGGVPARGSGQGDAASSRGGLAHAGDAPSPGGSRDVPAARAPGRWATPEAQGEPTARHECGLALVGDTLVLLGGRGQRPVDLFDLRTGRWRAGQAPPIPLHHFQAVAFRGRVHVLGALTGDYPAEPPVPVEHIYDPEADRWTTGTTVPPARRRGAAGLVEVGGRFYLAGGLTEGHNGGFVPWLDEYDPMTGAWRVLRDAPRPRDHFAAVAVGGRIVLAGGRTSSARTGQVLDLTIPEVDVYDLATGTWTVLPAAANLPTPRAGTAAVRLGEEVVVLGGESVAQQAAHAEVETLDLEAMVWRRLAPMQRGRHGMGAVVRGEELFVAAGSGNRGGGPELTSLERWSGD